MKAKVRKLDKMGGIAIPTDIRKSHNINKSDYMEILMDTEDDGVIVLCKHAPFCVFCERIEKIRLFKETNVCEDCVRAMKDFNNEG